MSWKNIYINRNPKQYSWMYNNGDANSLQYNFEWEPTKTTTKYYPYVGLSRQKIYADHSQQKDFCSLLQKYILWLQINCVVQMVPCYMELYRWRSWYIPNMEKIYFLFAQPGWFVLNTLNKILNDFPPFSFVHCSSNM